MARTKRYADSPTGPSGMPSSIPDFAIRRRNPAVVTLFFVLFGVMVLCLALSMIVQERTTLMLILFIIISSAAWYATLAVQRSYDLLMATEFQNALFSSAIGVNHKFCLIIKQDGIITYLDRAFQDMFPNFLRQSQRTVDVWLDHGKVAREDREEIFATIERGGFGKVIFVVRTAGDEYHKIVMSVEPILRPHGFILLRGREFVEKRVNDGTPSGFQKFDQMNKTVVSLFSQVVGTMKMGIYMTDPMGNLIYANPVLEQWLGFNEGEIVSGALALKDIISNDGSLRLSDLEDAEATVLMQKKHGGMLKTSLSQRVIRDEAGRVTGSSALVRYFEE